MNTPFLDLLRMFFGSPFSSTQRRALLVSLLEYSSHSVSRPIKETAIDPNLESWSFKHSLRDSKSSDVENDPVESHLQLNKNVPSLPLSATHALSLEDPESIPRGDVQFNTSESLSIVSNDGKTSLVINDRFIQIQRSVLTYYRKRESLDRKLDHFRDNIMSLENEIFRLERCKDDTDSGEKAAQIEVDLEHQKKELHDACEQREVLQHERNSVDIDYQCMRDYTQDMLKEFLENAGLFIIPEEDNDSIQETAESDHKSASGVLSVSTIVTMSELFLRGVAEELEEKRKTLHTMETGFNERYRDLANELANYHQAVQQGLRCVAQSEFDRRALVTFQGRTRHFIEAEARFEEAQTRARALGLLPNEWEQESKFVDEVDDGYGDSYETSATDGVCRDAIEAWAEDVLKSNDVETPGDAEADEWDAKSLDIGDSISCVDYTKNGSRIDRWRKKCETKDCDDTSSESYYCETGDKQ